MEAGDERGMQQLLLALDAGFPVLVLQNLGMPWYPQWHYATVTGYDLSTAKLVLNSGTHQDYRIPFSTFEHTWKRSNYWALLVVPPTKVPSFANTEVWNTAAFDLESTGKPAAALTAYRSSLQHWPGNQAALLGAGNSAFTLGQAGAAADYFYQLSVSSTDHAATGWNNLAYALQALHCPQAAARAAALAYQLAPKQSEIVQTFNEMTPADNHTYSETASGIQAQCQKWQTLLTITATSVASH